MSGDVRRRLMKHKRGSKAKKLKKRSPVAPPGFVMGKTSYDRSVQKRALEEELEQYLDREKAQQAGRQADLN